MRKENKNIRKMEGKSTAEMNGNDKEFFCLFFLHLESFCALWQCKFFFFQQFFYVEIIEKKLLLLVQTHYKRKKNHNLKQQEESMRKK
jgi:hypothetical protein